MALFRDDDFDAINERYFSDLSQSGGLKADLSGWRDTESAAAHLMPDLQFDTSRLDRYYLDEGNALGELKSRVLQLISAWEDRDISPDEVTLAPSVSAANLQVLIALRRRGFERVLFETPAYAVTMNQAIHAGFDVVPIPTYLGDGFRFDLDDQILNCHTNTVFWLTQPRMSLGFDQSPEAVAKLVKRAPEAVVVIDEATEQRFPSHLRQFTSSSFPNVIRTRGITKGLGLNGLRLSCTLHASSMRGEMESTQDVTGISLDYFSLAAAGQLGRDIPRFTRMLAAANSQTTLLRHRVAKIVAGSLLEPSHLSNGYIGSLACRIPERLDYETTRERMLEYCHHQGTYVILGASMRFAFDPRHEFIRVNYFNRESHVIGGVESLLAFSDILVGQYCE